MGAFLELPREIATALLFAAAIGIGAGALVAGPGSRVIGITPPRELGAWDVEFGAGR